MDYLERQGKRDAEKRFKVFAKKEFACETDAIAMFDDVMRTHRGSAYAVTREILRIEEAERRDKRGRPPKGSAGPGMKVKWKVGVTISFDERRAAELAYVHGISVIVTNLPRAPKDAENIRFGATSDTVLRLYLDQYKPEHTYRLMKSGMGVSSVYVHTPSRAAALLFTVAVATLVNSVMDALLRRNAKGKSRTVSRICTEIQGAILAYDRDGDEIYVMGPDGSASKVFSFMDSLGLDPSTLLDTFGG